MVYILLAVHIFFCFKTRFVQRYTLKGIAYTFSKGNSGTYAAFAQALGTTVGPGNIVGVAVAISSGGAGAIFWMWLCGILSMATKYAESFLCIKYRQNTVGKPAVGGPAVGGPMALLERAGYKKTAFCWVLLCLAAGLFMGAAVPSSALADALPSPRWLTGLMLALLTLAAMSQGADGISRICSLVVPVMSVGFIALCIVALALNYRQLPSAVAEIMTGAFCFKSVVGGGIGAAIKSGVTRGLYSNESGLGSGGVLASTARDSSIEMSALGAMTTAFWDTVVMCSLTGIVFVTGGADIGTDPEVCLAAAFADIPFAGIFVAVSMALFVYATVIGWYTVAVSVLPFCFRSAAFYNMLFVFAVFLGGVLPRELLWRLADSINYTMLLPSLFIFIKMSDKILYIFNKK